MQINGITNTYNIQNYQENRKKSPAQNVAFTGAKDELYKTGSKTFMFKLKQILFGMPKNEKVETNHKKSQQHMNEFDKVLDELQTWLIQRKLGINDDNNKFTIHFGKGTYRHYEFNPENKHLTTTDYRKGGKLNYQEEFDANGDCIRSINDYSEFGGYIQRTEHLKHKNGTVAKITKRYDDKNIIANEIFLGNKRPLGSDIMA